MHAFLVGVGWVYVCVKKKQLEMSQQTISTGKHTQMACVCVCECVSAIKNRTIITIGLTRREKNDTDIETTDIPARMNRVHTHTHKKMKKTKDKNFNILTVLIAKCRWLEYIKHKHNESQHKNLKRGKK